MKEFTLQAIEMPTYFEKDWWSKLEPTFFVVSFNDPITHHVTVTIQEKHPRSNDLLSRVIKVTEQEASFVDGLQSSHSVKDHQSQGVHPNELDLMAWMMDQDLTFIDLTMDFSLKTIDHYWIFIESLNEFLRNPEYSDLVFI